MVFVRLLRAAALAAAWSIGIAAPAAAAPVSFMLEGRFLALDGSFEPASGTLGFDDDASLGRTRILNEITLSLTAFGRTFTAADVRDVPGEPVLEFDDGVPTVLALDFDPEERVMFSLFDVRLEAPSLLRFTGSVDLMSLNPGPGTGSTGGGRPDGVIPLPATLPLLLGALGAGGLLLRRRPA